MVTQLGQEKLKKEAIQSLKDCRNHKLRHAIKILKVELLSTEEQLLVLQHLKHWMFESRKDDVFIVVIKSLYSWAEKLEWGKDQMREQLCEIVFEIVSWKGIFDDIDRQLQIKRLMTAIIAAESEKFIVKWCKWLQNRRKMIVDATLRKWIVEWSRKGSVKVIQEWEAFMKACFVMQTVTTRTTVQTCEILINKPLKGLRKEVETMIVWNGNGARARWTGNEELKKVVQATNPDLLCFLESKTNAENLLQLKGFEEWIVEAGFVQLYCYWSEKEGKKVYGNEGIVIFSKVKCETILYGIGNNDLDMQARVVTLIFTDCVIIVSYNPQGGYR